jgi:hypothetical protein
MTSQFDDLIDSAVQAGEESKARAKRPRRKSLASIYRELRPLSDHHVEGVIGVLYHTDHDVIAKALERFKIKDLAPAFAVIAKLHRYRNETQGEE